MPDSYKITALTPSNVEALREVFADSIAKGHVVVTASTASFPKWCSPVASLDDKMNELARRIHAGEVELAYTRNSLHAVRRKLAKVTA